MKISHRDLDACRRDPRQWVSGKLNPSSGFPSWGYDRVLKLGLHKLHKGSSLDAAREHIENFLARYGKLNNAARIVSVFDRLVYYDEWLRTSGTIVADSSRNVQLDRFGFLTISGQIDRIDFTDTGHRAVLLGDAAPDWQQQLRMPILQLTVAHTYGVPVSEVAVGVQQLDGSGLNVKIYAADELTAAEEELRTLSNRVREIHNGLLGST